MCRERGKTPYSVLQELLLTWMEERKRPARFTGWHSSGGG